MTAPDPGLTDLIAAHVLSGPYIEYDSDGHHADDFYRCGENCKWTSNEGTVSRSAFAAHAAHVALVVEQHANGRIAELEAENRTLTFSLEDETRDCEGWKIRAEKAEATIARVDKLAAEYARDDQEHLNTFGQHHPVAGIAHDHLRAALEGEQQ